MNEANKDILLLKTESLIEKIDHTLRSLLDAREALVEAKDLLENEE